jgi:UDP-glucose 4-epimerase
MGHGGGGTALGQSGSHVVDYLIDRYGYDVTVLDDLSGGFKENVNTKARFYKLDINSKKIEEMFLGDIYAYLHPWVQHSIHYCCSAEI